MPDGDYYARCPTDGCLEVEPVASNSGRDPHSGAEYRDWGIFHASPHAGGCGETWSTTTQTGVARARARGINPKGLTRAAAVARAYSLPSSAFRANWDRAFGRAAAQEHPS